MDNSPIIITGCARSGTSMVAGTINMSGAFGGNMHGPNKYNAKGMFENVAVKMTLDKPYLSFIGCDTKGQYPLPDTEKLLIPNDWGDKVRAIFESEGYTSGPWMIKLARACLTWPVWHHAFPNAKWIIVRRRDTDIIDSCMNTAFMNHYTTPEGWQGWVDHHKKCFVEMVEAGLNVKQIWPERMIISDYSAVHDMIDWLGLTWKPEEVENFISPKLWHSRRKVITNLVEKQKK